MIKYAKAIVVVVLVPRGPLGGRDGAREGGGKEGGREDEKDTQTESKFLEGGGRERRKKGGGRKGLTAMWGRR